MNTSYPSWSRQLSTAAALALVTIASPARAQSVPPVPASLDVPSGQSAYLVAHATGTQNYVCTLAPGGFQWTFFGPQATLFDGATQQIATHFLSANPDEGGKARATWQHSQDSSAVWAVAIASSTDATFVEPNAIPWLLLRAVGTEDGAFPGGTLSTTTFIQRVNTAGGLAPGTGCGQAADIGVKALVPYTADYVFYR